MTDVAREKYARLMAEIEILENKIELSGKESVNPAEVVVLKNDLAAKRNELSRLSDGCGHPHPQS